VVLTPNICQTPSQSFRSKLIFSLVKMKPIRVSKIGLVLAGFGLLIILGYAIWAKSIRTTVLDIRVPMKAEAVSQDFSVDYDALYTMWVKFDRSVSLHEGRCLLGAKKSELDADLDCKDFAPLLKFAWALSRGGKNGATGHRVTPG
jgi:hypothetical protein